MQIEVVSEAISHNPQSYAPDCSLFVIESRDF